MAEPLSAQKRAEMREVYLEHRSVESVVRFCDVAWVTADKYRVEDEWDRACARVDKLAEDIAVKKIGRYRADTIRIAYASIVKMARDLEKKTELPWNAQDVDKMARLVELLSGGADSRPGTAGQVLDELRKLGTAELDELLAGLGLGTPASAGAAGQPDAPMVAGDAASPDGAESAA